MLRRFVSLQTWWLSWFIWRCNGRLLIRQDWQRNVKCCSKTTQRWSHFMQWMDTMDRLEQFIWLMELWEIRTQSWTELSRLRLWTVWTSAPKSSIRRFVITEKATTRAWLKAATTAFTFKTLLRHYAKRALTPRSLNVKFGPRCKGHKGRAVWLA